jgi:hypothetical protein
MLQEKFPPPPSKEVVEPAEVGDTVIATDAENKEVEGILSEIVAVDGGVIRGKITKKDGQEIDVIVKSKKDPYSNQPEKKEDIESILDDGSETPKTETETQPSESLEDFLLKSEEKTRIKNPTNADLLDLVEDDAEYGETELRNKGGKKPRDPEPPPIEEILNETSATSGAIPKQQEERPIESILSRTSGPKDSTFNVFDTSGSLKKLKELIANAPRPPRSENLVESETTTQASPQIIEATPPAESSASEKIEITEAIKPTQEITEVPPKKRGRKPKAETPEVLPVSIDSINENPTPIAEGPDSNTSPEIENPKPQTTEQIPLVDTPEITIPAENNPEIQNSPEEELTVEEKLDSARSKYAEYLSKNEAYQKQWDAGKGLSIEENTESGQIKNQLLPEAKKNYLEARSAFLKEKISEYENGALEKELRTYFGNELIDLKSHSEKRLKEQYAIELHKEFKLLYDQKTENLAQSKKSTFLEKTLDKVRALGKSYSNQPTRKKILLGLALGAGGGLAALSGGGVMGALGFLIGGGKILQKIAAGSATFVTVEALVKRSQDKKLAEISNVAEKEMLEEIKFASNLYERGERASGLTKFLEARNDILELEFNERYNDLEKTKRRMAKRRLLYSSAAGLVIGSGVIAKTLSMLADASGIHPLEGLKDKVESVLGKEPSALGGRSTLPAEIPDATETPVETTDQPVTESNSNAINKSITPETNGGEVFDNAKNLEDQISKPIATIKSGGNIWETAKSLVNNGKITESEFRTAWGNTTIDVNGVETPISEVGLSHPGDQLVFISGPNPHFEISTDFAKDHLKLGTNDDLYRYLKSSGKPIPSWLTEKFGK